MAKYKKKLDADIRGPLEYGLTIFGGKSGEYPQKLYKALMNSQTVLTVWDDARLVGLIRVLDDSEMLAQIHYVLVHPEYQGQGIAGRMVEYIKEKYKNYHDKFNGIDDGHASQKVIDVIKKVSR